MVAVKAENVWAGRKSTEKATSEEIKWRDALIEELEYHNISIRHPVYIDEAMVRAERLLNGTTLIPTKYLSDDVKKEFVDKVKGLPENEKDNVKVFFTLMFYWYGWNKKGLEKVSEAVQKYVNGAELTDLAKEYLPSKYYKFYEARYEKNMGKVGEELTPKVVPSKVETSKTEEEVKVLTNLHEVINLFARCEENKDKVQWSYVATDKILYAHIITDKGIETYGIKLDGIEVNNADEAYTLAAELDYLGTVFPQLYNFSGFHEVGTTYTAKSAEDLDYIVNFTDTALSKNLNNVDLRINENTGRISIIIKVGKRTLTYVVNEETINNVGDIVGGPFLNRLCNVFFDNHPEWSENEKQAFFDRLRNATLVLLSQSKETETVEEKEKMGGEKETKSKEGEIVNVMDKQSVLMAFDELESMIKKEDQMGVIFSGDVLVISYNNRYLLDKEAAALICKDSDLLSRYEELMDLADHAKNREFGDTVKSQLEMFYNLINEMAETENVEEMRTGEVTGVTDTTRVTILPKEAHAIGCNTKEEIRNALEESIEFIKDNPTEFPFEYLPDSKTIVIKLGDFVTYHLTPISANLIKSDDGLKNMFDTMMELALTPARINDDKLSQWKENITAFFKTPELFESPKPTGEDVTTLFDKNNELIVELKSAEFDETNRTLTIVDEEGRVYILTPEDIMRTDIPVLGIFYDYFNKKGDKESKRAVGEFARLI